MEFFYQMNLQSKNLNIKTNYPNSFYELKDFVEDILKRIIVLKEIGITIKCIQLRKVRKLTFANVQYFAQNLLSFSTAYVYLRF